MPKVTTLANKENIVPLSKTSRKTKVSLRDDDDHDEVIRLGDIKRSKSNTTASSSQQVRSGSKSSREAIDSDPRQHASSSGDSEYARRKKEVALSEGEDDDDKHERKSRRERMLEEKLALIARERDQIQGQFDELREMRQTESERLLVDFKKAASQRDAKAEEYINKLKSQLETLSVSSKKDKDSAMSSSSDGAFLHMNGKDGDNSRKYREEIARLQQTNETLTNALRGRTVQGTAGGSIDDAKAIRRLYEDLTGLVINKVESAINREKDYHRCFHAIFASDGYFNLEMKFEESESVLTTNGRHQTREDLVYIPTMDADRDADIIASGRLPSYLAEPLRFERSTAVRFIDVLHKRLDKTSKK